MSYKTILVHVDQTAPTAARIRLAAQLAAQQEAHLSAVATTGVAQVILQNSALETVDPNLGIYFDLLRERAELALKQFAPLAHDAGVRSCDSHLVNTEAAGEFIALARSSDLIVLGQTDAQALSPTVGRDFAQAVMMQAGRPVLIVPYAGHFLNLGQRVLVAWDGSLEAARAVSAALPLLKRAKMVDVVVLNAPAVPDVSAEVSGADIVANLKRHGVTAELSLQRTGTDIGNALLSLAADLNSDLLVMGGYGHSRFRELLLGGATRTVLEAMTLPVLMAH